MLLHNENKEEIKTYLDTNKNGNTTTQNLWHTAKVVLIGKFTGLSQKPRNISNKQSNLTSKGTKKRRTNKAQTE